MALNVGHVEHVHQIRFPLASSDPEAIKEIAEDVARKVYAQGNGEFARFPRLPSEIQDMIWKATIEPRTVRAIGYSKAVDSGAESDSEPEHFGPEPPLNSYLALECNALHVRLVPAYSVCRRSRAVALATYGPLLDNNTTPFHPDLDTIELVRCFPLNWCEADAPRAISRYASEQGRIDFVKLPQKLVRTMRNEWESTLTGFVKSTWSVKDQPLYFKEAIDKKGPHDLRPWRRQWALSQVPLVAAKNVVLCHQSGHFCMLEQTCLWASVMLPNTEALTIRTNVGDMRSQVLHAGDEWAQSRLSETFSSMILKHKEEGCWPKLKTIDFTRQCVPLRVF